MSKPEPASTNSCTPENAKWLVECANSELSSVPDPAQRDALRLADHFRKRHDRERSRLLCELHEIRRRAKAKFARASEMFFTRTGYEQSSSERIAQYKAARFPAEADAVDLCCGIGGDAIAIGKRCANLTIVDRSAPVLTFAAENLRLHGVRDVVAICEDVRKIDLSRFSVWHLDPDRRPASQRHSAPEICEPGLTEFLEIARTSSTSPRTAWNGAIKLSPAADVLELLEKEAELEWIGENRECKQLVAWFGDMARHPGKRTATWLTDSGESATLVEKDSADPVPTRPVQSQLPKYVYEPKPSVLAARLQVSLAHQCNLEMLASDTTWLCADHAAESQLLSRFETIAGTRLKRGHIKKWIGELGVSVNEVKTRGIDIDPQKLLKQVATKTKSKGEPATLILLPIDQSIYALVARRCH